MQKIAIAGIAVALLASTGFATTAEARCVRDGMTSTCRHMVRLHHHRHFAAYRHAYRGYGYAGYGYGGYGYGSSYSPYDNTSSASATAQHNQGTGN
ncbi:MAG TPA: hypothetical protein VHU15_05995 [Stellaceae bacterium]|jgi:hypothetical protein|nr:hypothetical protein [Stellaceae bacterium]